MQKVIKHIGYACGQADMKSDVGNKESDMRATHIVEYIVVECIDHSFVAYDLVDGIVCLHVHHFN